MTQDVLDDSTRLAALLLDIAAADAAARFHDRAGCDRLVHAEAAQQADEMAEASRRAARRMIEKAFPGISWARIAAAGL